MGTEAAFLAFDAAWERTDYDVDVHRGDRDGDDPGQSAADKKRELILSLRMLADAARDLANELAAESDAIAYVEAARDVDPDGSRGPAVVEHFDASLTGQQRAVAVLAAILTMPELDAASWIVWPDSMSDSAPEIVGQLAGARPAAEARAAIDAYVLKLQLSRSGDKELAGTGYCEAFTKISASGLVDGVSVKVWGAAR